MNHRDTEGTENNAYRVGDGQTGIVTDPIIISWNEVMETLAEFGEQVAQFGRDIEADRAQSRQRVKDDVRKKRKEMMRRRKL